VSKATGSSSRATSRSSGAKLTDDNLDVIAGCRDQIEGKLQERYGYARDEAKTEIDSWYNSRNWLS